MSCIILFLLYQVATLVSIPIVCILILIIRLKGKPVIGSWMQRLGYVPRVRQPARRKKTIWFHAASVGEVLSIQYLLDTMRKQIPDAVYYVTVSTPHGKHMAEQHLSAEYISYLPFDFLPCIILLFSRIKPTSLYLVEAEIWPNLLMYAHFKRIPCSLINARISKKALVKYQRLRWLYSTLFSLCKTILVQSEQDRQHFIQFGQQKKKLMMLGNIKAYNVRQKHRYHNQNYFLELPKQSRVTLLVGSMHQGELDTYLSLFSFLTEHGYRIRLILVPRYPHIQDACEHALTTRNISYMVWDRSDIKEQEIPDENTVILICVLGALFDMYAYADIFFLGGTFVPIGGHNLLEPAVWGRASIVGPHHENCSVSVQELAYNDALIHVKNQDELKKATCMLINDAEKRKKMGAAAALWLQQHAHVVEHQLLLFLRSYPFLDNRLRNKRML